MAVGEDVPINLTLVAFGVDWEQFRNMNRQDP
jgi:hypothetical protein